MDLFLQAVGSAAVGFAIGYGIARLAEWAEARDAKRRRGEQ